MTNFLAFTFVYLFLTFTLVPIAAKQFGRVQLPITGSASLKPLTLLTVVLNRNYVRPPLREIAETVAAQISDKYPGTIVSYLDAGFPFINKFPLFPHLSHNDGKKLDLSFLYTKSNPADFINGSPSPIGYGVCEEPMENEANTAQFCSEKGYWQYGFLRKIMTQRYKKDYTFDPSRTRQMIVLFTSSNEIEKLFIEPHLKARMHLEDNTKVRFHGCAAVRHDDHIHIQIK